MACFLERELNMQGVVVPPTIINYAEAQARTVIRDISDGEYFFADYADGGGVHGTPG